MDDPTKEFRRLKELKELERLNGSGPAPHELKSSGLMTGLATLFVIGLALIVGMTLAAAWQPEASEDFYPTPIATSAWHVTRDLQPTPTLMPTQPPQPAPRTLATAVPSTDTPVPTWTIAPSSTPVPTWTPAATATPYPTLTAAPTWTTAPTYTPQPTHTPYPTATAVPATETPTPIPATATAAPTLLPPVLPPGPGPEVVIVESGGDGWLSYLLAVIDLALVVYIFYQLWIMRRSPAPTTPLPAPLSVPVNGKPATGHPSPLQARRAVESSESSRRVQPVQPVELAELIPEVRLPFSKDRAPDPAERAYIRRRYAETGNLTAVCMECYNSKGGKVWAWVKGATEERPAAGQGGQQPEQSQPAPKRPKRPFFVNTNRGRMEV